MVSHIREERHAVVLGAQVAMSCALVVDISVQGWFSLSEYMVLYIRWVLDNH